MTRKRVLVLFPQEWDRLALDDVRLRSRYEFHWAGFDLFRFPDNARLLAFDIERFVARLARWCARRRIDAVLSTHEQFGTLAAALLAQRLGLPGNDPHAVVRAQHKLVARQCMARTLPRATPAFCAFPYTVRSAAEVALPFPFFVKPVKATFSVLARRVDSFAQLRRHLYFAPFERHIIKRLVRPFNDVLHRLGGYPLDAHHLIGESLFDGLQVNVDGYVCAGEAHVLGVVDEVMYPGTMHFNRFEYPSSLPEHVQARVRAIAVAAVQAVGYRHGFFNVELMVDPHDDAIRVVEINPRMASQFATLYQWVDGIDLYAIELALALGDAPPAAAQPRAHRCAASFVFRKFDGRPVAHPPGGAQVARVQARHPEARLMLYFKRGVGLRREMKWLGSHRYAVLNLPGTDHADLYARYRDIRDSLGFDADPHPEPMPLWPAAAPRRA